jgi:hypothetical protein
MRGVTTSHNDADNKDRDTKCMYDIDTHRHSHIPFTTYKQGDTFFRHCPVSQFAVTSFGTFHTLALSVLKWEKKAPTVLGSLGLFAYSISPQHSYSKVLR